MNNRGVMVRGRYFTGHALQRCAEMRLDLLDIVDVMECPTHSYPGDAPYGLNRRLAVGQGLVVVHHPASGTVITVLWDGAEGRHPHRTSSIDTVK